MTPLHEQIAKARGKFEVNGTKYLGWKNVDYKCATPIALFSNADGSYTTVRLEDLEVLAGATP